MTTALAKIVAAGSLFGVMAAGTAGAAPVTYSFTGTVTVDTSWSGGVISLNELVAGTFSYDTTTLDQEPGDSSLGVYALTGLTVTYLGGGYTAASSGGTITIGDNDFGLLDWIQIRAFPVEGLTGPSVAGREVSEIGIFFRDFSKSVFSSDALLTTLPPFSAFPDAKDGGVSFGNFLDQNYENAIFKLTSLSLFETEVPVPSALATLALGLLGFGATRRRKARGTQTLSIALFSGLLATLLTAAPNGAQATTVTYTFSGTTDLTYDFVQHETLAGFFSYGQDWTLTVKFDLGVTPTSTFATSEIKTNYWKFDSVLTSMSMSVGGETYTLGDSLTGEPMRYASWSNTWNTLYMESWDKLIPLGGSATSTNANVDSIYFNWGLTSYEGPIPIDSDYPDFLPSLNLNDWEVHKLSFSVYDLEGICDVNSNDNCNAVGSANFHTSIFSRFATVTVTSDQDAPVPLPGALALLGLGLFCFGAMRRRKVV